MGKGVRPKNFYDDKKYKANYDEIDWGAHRKKKKVKVKKDERKVVR